MSNKTTRFVVSRTIPGKAFYDTKDKQKLIQGIQSQMARECVEHVMDKMIFIENKDESTGDISISGVVHILSEQERMEIGSQKASTSIAAQGTDFWKQEKVYIRPAVPEPPAAYEPPNLVPGLWSPKVAEKARQIYPEQQGWKEVESNFPPSSTTASGLAAKQAEVNRELNKKMEQMQEDLVIHGKAAMMIDPALQDAGELMGVDPGKMSKLTELLKPENLTKFVATSTPGGKLGLLNKAFGMNQDLNKWRSEWMGIRYCLTTTGELIMSKQFWETGSQFDGELDQIKQLPPVTVLIDGDIVAYRCAATCDGRHYLIDGQRFGYKKDAVNYADKQGLPNSQIEQAFDPEPVDAALHNINVTMDNIKNYFIYEKKMNPQIKTFLSADRNFRYDVYPDYKKSRKSVRKPHWIRECKEFMQTQHGAFKFDDHEADDLIAMTTDALRKDKVVYIASCDKDFTQLGGENVVQYDFTTGKEWAVTELQALAYFYKQILIGDKADDIPGIPKVGPQTALKILAGVTNERVMYNTVVLAYKDKMELTTKEAVETVSIRGKLLHLLREEGKLWTPPPPRDLET